MLVAFDTSTNQIGLACYDAGTLLAECSWDSARDHTAQLLPQLDHLLGDLRRERREISAVGVALGPGSWSGLRVGLSTAKGLALALDIPIIGIGTLDALRYQYEGAGLPVVPLIRLGRDRYATYDQRLREPSNVTLAGLAADIGDRVLFCGDVDQEVRRVLEQALGERARFPGGASALRRAGFLAELAWQRLQNGSVDDLATLEPIYLGQPVRSAG